MAEALGDRDERYLSDTKARLRSETTSVEYPNGDKEYYRDGKLHRDNDPVLGPMPAIERANGDKEYYKDDKCHRDNDPILGPMPAVECANGYKAYYKHGELHRDDTALGPMPAIECANGEKYYYKNGIQFTLVEPNQVKLKLIKMREELDLIIKSLN